MTRSVPSKHTNSIRLRSYSYLLYAPTSHRGGHTHTHKTPLGSSVQRIIRQRRALLLLQKWYSLGQCEYRTRKVSTKTFRFRRKFLHTPPSSFIHNDPFLKIFV